MKIRVIVAAAAIALTAASLVPSIASAQSRVKAGILSCRIAGGVGLIIGSQKSVSCRFRPAVRGPGESYAGAITKVGLDIGFTRRGRMVWTVFASAPDLPGGLAGTYVGASAEATIAAGLGANVAVGVAELRLHALR